MYFKDTPTPSTLPHFILIHCITTQYLFYTLHSTRFSFAQYITTFIEHVHIIILCRLNIAIDVNKIIV